MTLQRGSVKVLRWDLKTIHPVADRAYTAGVDPTSPNGGPWARRQGRPRVGPPLHFQSTRQ